MTNPKNNVRQMPKPLTEEEKKQQVLRFLAQKRESYIQLILANVLQNPSVMRETKVTVKMDEDKAVHQFNIIDIVDLAIEGADYLMSKMYTEEKPTE